MVLGLLFVLLGVYRESLVPWSSPPERARWLLTGDEPTYLLMGLALRAGDGLNIAPALARGDLAPYYPRALFPERQYTWAYYFGHWIKPARDLSAEWGDARKAPFTPLVPFLLVPLLLLFENVRWWWGLAQALAVLVVAALALRRAERESPEAAGLTALAFLCGLGTMPAGYFATQLFPELIAALLLLLAFHLRSAGAPRPPLLADLLLYATLWATPRTAPLVALYSVWRVVECIRGRHYLHLLSPVAGWSLFVGANLAVWGTYFPPMASSFLKSFLRPALAHGPLGLLKSLLAFFCANDTGLLLLCPFACVTVGAGTLAALRTRSGDARLLALLFWASAFTTSLYTDTRAGTCPAGRYQVIPAALALAALVLLVRTCPEAWRRRLAWSTWVLGGLSLAISAAVMAHPVFWFKRYHPLFGYKPIQSFYEALPDFEGDGWLGRSLIVLAVLGGLALLPDLARAAAATLRRARAAARR